MPYHDFTPISALAGGALIGLAASALLLTHGRVAGISYIVGGLLQRHVTDRAYRVGFLAGLLAAGIAARLLFPRALGSAPVPLAAVLVAGLLVGFGTRLGSGCTSGHGVCGLSRLSVRSLVATVTFMTVGFATVFFLRHLL